MQHWTHTPKQHQGSPVHRQLLLQSVAGQPSSSSVPGLLLQAILHAQLPAMVDASWQAAWKSWLWLHAGCTGLTTGCTGLCHGQQAPWTPSPNGEYPDSNMKRITPTLHISTAGEYACTQVIRLLQLPSLVSSPAAALVTARRLPAAIDSPRPPLHNLDANGKHQTHARQVGKACRQPVSKGWAPSKMPLRLLDRHSTAASRGTRWP